MRKPLIVNKFKGAEMISKEQQNCELDLFPILLLHLKLTSAKR